MVSIGKYTIDRVVMCAWAWLPIHTVDRKILSSETETWYKPRNESPIGVSQCSLLKKLVRLFPRKIVAPYFACLILEKNKMYFEETAMITGSRGWAEHDPERQSHLTLFNKYGLRYRGADKNQRIHYFDFFLTPSS